MTGRCMCTTIVADLKRVHALAFNNETDELVLLEKGYLVEDNRNETSQVTVLIARKMCPLVTLIVIGSPLIAR